MFKTYCLLVLLALSGLLWSTPSAFGQGTFGQDAAGQGVSAEDVRAAIERAVDYLKRAQHPDGTWEERHYYEGGLTPLCTLALLQAGCSPQDEAVAKALTTIHQLPLESTYTISLQTMIYCALDPVAYGPMIARNVKWLESRQVLEGGSQGMWAIHEQGSTDHIDNSMTHFAMLALYEAERAGIPVADITWELGRRAWRKGQNADGSWGWGPGHPGSGSMTTAGIAAMTIARGRLGADATVEGNQVICCGQQALDPAVERGMQWLEKHFSVNRNPGSSFWLSYYLYSLERAAHVTSQRFIGDHDWYREGAESLCKRQTISGGWLADMDFEYGNDPLVSTSFSLLFLAKGQRPVLISHLAHQSAEDWNPHRNALFNLVSYLEKNWEMTLAQQIVDISLASVEDLRESPVLFLNGRTVPDFTDAEIQKLRSYLEQGGFLFAEQTCGDGSFDRDFRTLMERVFAGTGAQLRPLPPGHPAWYAEQPIVSAEIQELWGVELGCRTAVIYSPQDLSCYWEIGRVGREKAYPPSVRKQIQTARGVAANILAYATNRQLRVKSPELPPSSQPRPTIERGKLRVARLQHGSQPTDNSHAWTSVLQLANGFLGLRAEDPIDEVSLGDPRLFEYPMIFFSGRVPFRFSSSEREQLRQYLERGGVLFAEANGSSQPFADAFRREMGEILPEAPLTRISPSDKIFSDTLGGEPLPLVNFRHFEDQPGHPHGEAIISQREPLLEGATIGGHYAVLFSPYDITCALGTTAILSFEGYTSEAAAQIMFNVMLYALTQY